MEISSALRTTSFQYHSKCSGNVLSALADSLITPNSSLATHHTQIGRDSDSALRPRDGRGVVLSIESSRKSRERKASDRFRQIVSVCEALADVVTVMFAVCIAYASYYQLGLG